MHGEHDVREPLRPARAALNTYHTALPALADRWRTALRRRSGGPRLPYAFCNASLPLEARLDDLLARTTYEEKAGVLTSNGLAIPRLGVPQLGSGEDTHGIASGCISPAAPNSTGCPTCFPAGPNTGAAFDRELWAAIGETIGREGRALNNLQSAPLYFFDPDMNLMRDPRCALLSSCTKQPQHLEPPSIIVYGTA
jgi:hypothetical protein